MDLRRINYNFTGSGSRILDFNPSEHGHNRTAGKHCTNRYEGETGRKTKTRPRPLHSRTENNLGEACMCLAQTLRASNILGGRAAALPHTPSRIPERKGCCPPPMPSEIPVGPGTLSSRPLIKLYALSHCGAGQTPDTPHPQILKSSAPQHVTGASLDLTSSGDLHASKDMIL